MTRALDLLVVAPSARNLYQELANEFSAKEPNIWAGLLANSARSVGYGVAIYDMEIERPTEEEFADVVKEHDPRLVLFVVTGQNPNASTAAMSGAVEAAEGLRDRLPEYKIAFVGPHINALPLETLSDNPFIDIGLTNEGVYALLGLLDTDMSCDSMKSVHGLCYREEDGNLNITHPSRTVPQERLHIDRRGGAYDEMSNLDKY